MKSLYFKIGKIIEKIERLLLMVLSTVMAFSVFFQIIIRTFFNTTILELEDVAKYSFVWLIFIGTAYVFQSDDHVAITFFVSNLPTKVARIVDYIQRVLVTIFLCTLIIQGITFVKQGMTEYLSQLRISAWMVYTIIPLFAILSLYSYIGYLFGWNKPKDLEAVVTTSV